MWSAIREWYRRHFTDPNAVELLVAATLGIGLVWGTSGYLSPFWGGLTLAYLLEPLVSWLEARARLPRETSALFLILFLSFSVTYFGFLGLLLEVVDRIHQGFEEGVGLLQEALGRDVVEGGWAKRSSGLTDPEGLAGQLVRWAAHALPWIEAGLIWIAIVPLVSFFFLKDWPKLLAFFQGHLSTRSPVTLKVIIEVDRLVKQYALAKLAEAVLTGLVLRGVLGSLGVPHAQLLSVASGLATFFPYLGAIFMALPVGFFALDQWGWKDPSALCWALGSYAAVQFVIGNFLSFLLFSGATELHPLLVIFSTLFFGGLWGDVGALFFDPVGGFSSKSVASLADAFGSISCP